MFIIDSTYRLWASPKVLRISMRITSSIRISNRCETSWYYLLHFLTYSAQDNIVITDDGDARICDFGGSHITAASKSVAKPSTGIRGTLRYIAYELVASTDQYLMHTKESDVWAFGMTIFVSLAYIHYVRSKFIPLITGAFRPRTPIRASRRHPGDEGYYGSWSPIIPYMDSS